MRSDGTFWVEELWILDEPNVFVVIAHEAEMLSLQDLCFDLLLLALAQSGDVSAVNSSGVRRLKLRQHPHVLVVWLDAVLAKNALDLFSLEWVLHLNWFIVVSGVSSLGRRESQKIHFWG